MVWIRIRIRMVGVIGMVVRKRYVLGVIYSIWIYGFGVAGLDWYELGVVELEWYGLESLSWIVMDQDLLNC